MNQYSPEICRANYLQPEVCDDKCPGPLTSSYETQSESTKGTVKDYYVFVCRSPLKMHLPARCIDFCGNGPDVLTMHRSTLPPHKEVEELVREF